mmetsp:Transcript_76791/g.217286  ORF Transcript_76791/g.217286 Transcript_76791/m.217286 type:complete len:312 (+) Transcript_76791:1146-2081(+)
MCTLGDTGAESFGSRAVIARRGGQLLASTLAGGDPSERPPSRQPPPLRQVPVAWAGHGRAQGCLEGVPGDPQAVANGEPPRRRPNLTTPTPDDAAARRAAGLSWGSLQSALGLCCCGTSTRSRRAQASAARPILPEQFEPTDRDALRTGLARWSMLAVLATELLEVLSPSSVCRSGTVLRASNGPTGACRLRGAQAVAPSSAAASTSCRQRSKAAKVWDICMWVLSKPWALTRSFWFSCIATRSCRSLSSSWPLHSSSCRRALSHSARHLFTSSFSWLSSEQYTGRWGPGCESMRAVRRELNCREWRVSLR